MDFCSEEICVICAYKLTGAKKYTALLIGTAGKAHCRHNIVPAVKP
jgi:hypothetical protein